MKWFREDQPLLQFCLFKRMPGVDIGMRSPSDLLNESLTHYTSYIKFMMQRNETCFAVVGLLC